jgi:hypothetical protein
MTMPLTRSTLTAALAALLLAAPSATAKPADIHARLHEFAAAADPQDLRSPDARDAANRSQSPTSSPAGTKSRSQDLRSPDTRDVAGGREFPAPPTVITLKPVPDREPVASGFDWVAAAAGVGTALGLILLIPAGSLLSRRRKHRDQRVAVS